MSRDKSIQEKLRGLFKTFKGSAPPKARFDEYVVLTEEIEAELQPDALLVYRVKAAKELTEICKIRRAESHTIEKIWSLVNDLLRPKNGQMPTKETRHTIFALLTALCQSQLEKTGTGVLRAKFFTFIKSHDLPEDFLPKFRFLQSLTNNGKDVSYFDERIGPLLHDWMSERHTKAIPVADFMSFLVNIIKFNQSFLDHDILVGIIQNVCFVSCTCSARDDVTECLNVLSAVLCYGSLPPGCLPNFLATLCRTVNIDHILCQSSWKIMRNLLGTHLGHSALFTMCNFMENSERSEDVSVIRGAVFFVGVSLWGSKMIRSLKYSTNSALISFERALVKKHPSVIFEVILRVQDLVKTNGEGLQTISWDLILQIIWTVIEYAKTDCAKEDPSRQVKIMKAANDTLDSIESILETRSFCGHIAEFYKIIDSCYLSRPISSVEKLMEYKVSTPLHKPGWFQELISFADKHLRQEVRPVAKAKAMLLITKICLANRDIYEEDLIEKIILPHMKNLEHESDPLVRKSGVNFLVDFLMESSSKKGHDLLFVLEKVVNRPYEIQAQSRPDTAHIFTDSEVLDIVTCIDGIVKLFKKKIYNLPSSIAVTAYKILVKHLGNHYKKISVLENCSLIRYKIFECFFEIRANSLYHLGFPREGAKVLSYSSYLAVDHRDGDEKQLLDQYGLSQDNPGQLSNLPTASAAASVPVQQQQFTAAGPSVTYISLTAACKLVVGSLKKEKDWNILKLVLTNLPSVLENKALILSKHGNDIDYLANALCSMTADKTLNLPESLRNCPQKFSRTDFHGFLYPIFTALVSYHSHLESGTQLKIVKCLQQGLVSRPFQRTCILALTICTLEMKDTMHKLLPDVLLSLSKISPLVNIAIPVLEFLSTLIHLPRVFASFVQDQYMSIFAIALPYTNPFKFNQYTVSLAHHVIAMWFLKCRLSFRRDFVTYIIRGLESNVWTPLEEESRRQALELRNEDSSNRKRSSSLTEQSQKRRERPISGHTGAVPPQPHAPAGRLSSFDAKPTADKSLQKFHHELTETCIDFMARYCYSDCSALPTRFTTTNFLVTGGSSQSWMIDNRIITITTSGCTQKELKDGVCDKCYLCCQKQRSFEESRSNDTPSSGLGRSLSVRGVDCSSSSNSLANRRRHRSAYAVGGYKKTDSSGTTMKPGGQSEGENSSGGGEAEKQESKDDLHLENKLMIDSTPGKEGGIGNLLGGSSPFLPEYVTKTKHELCTCWCNGWAEIMIRSPTGNTSWMMRVQNQIGNHHSTDYLFKDLSSIYLQNIVENYLPADSFVSSSATSSTLSSPTQSQRPLLVSQNSMSQDSMLAGNTSPNAPGSPTTPDSPTDEADHLGRKIPVRRSNSSPEMSSSNKHLHLNLQKDIEEQDEDEVLQSSGEHKSEQSANSTSPRQTSNGETKSQTSPPVPELREKDSNSIMKGNTSPFRRSYEAIPEENTQKGGGSLASSPEANKQVDVIGPMKRDRISTISVMTPARRNHNQVRRMLSLGSGDSVSGSRFGGSNSTGETGIRSGISPGFVFLQLCAQGTFGKTEKPLLLPPGENSARSLRVFDNIPPYETHKIGVVYVGPGQAQNETAILQNQYGSGRYRDFLEGLGSLIKLTEIDPQKVCIGGLSKDGTDGEFACMWQDDVMQVIFHVATLMPNKAPDPSGNDKKRHIGNDHVAIVYNNCEEEYDISTVKGKFLYAWVLIQPLDHKTNRVVVKAAKPILEEHIGHSESKIVSDQNLPIMVRQLALHANLASVIFQKMQTPNSDLYASNWLERLRHMKRIRSRLYPDSGVSSSEELPLAGDSLSASASLKHLFVEDFTNFV